MSGPMLLLINPALDARAQDPALSALLYSSMPVGLGYLAATVQQRCGLPVQILDEAVAPVERATLERWLKPPSVVRWVGLSSVTLASGRAYELARQIKDIAPDLPVFIGGPHPTARPDEALETGCIDVVVRHEGEDTLVELLQKSMRGEALVGVAGTSWRTGDGRCHHAEQRPCPDLATLPPFPYELFAEHQACYNDFGMIVTSRGCPFPCIFCSNRIVIGRQYRVFPDETVFRAVGDLIGRYGQRLIQFMDDNFVVDRARFFRLIDGFMARGYHQRAQFAAQARGVDLTPEVVAAMKRANFVAVGTGTETASERLMTTLRKCERVAEVVAGIENANRAGLAVQTTFIFGIPGETAQDRRDSFALACRLPITSARFNTATPYPGTELHAMALRENRLHVAPAWRNFSVQYYLFGNDLPYVPQGTGRFRLILDTMLANLGFYLQPRRLWAALTRIDTGFGGVISLQHRRSSLTMYAHAIRVAGRILARLVEVSLRAWREHWSERRRAGRRQP